MRLIQIGAGGFGRTWAGIIQEAERVELAAVADGAVAARQWAETGLGLGGGAVFASLDEAVAGVAADAVLVATPPETHHAVARAALLHGKHVLVEKPLATTLADARDLVTTADHAGRTLMVSQNYRFRPPARAAHEVVRSGALGDLLAVTIQFQRDTRRQWPADNFRYGMRHPVVLDMSIHHLDLLRLLTGTEVLRVDARGWRVPDSPYAHDPAVVAIFDLASGATAIYEGNWATHDAETSWNGAWELLGERGRLRWTGGESDATTGDITLDLRGEPPRAIPLPPLAYVDRAGTLHAFQQAVATGQEPETSGRDNLQSLATVLATVASIERTEAVSVSSSEPLGSYGR